MQELLLLAQYRITPQVADQNTMISTGPNAIKLAVSTFFLMLGLGLVVFFIFSYYKKRNAAVSVSEDIRKTVDKQKGLLLELAMQKRKEREKLQKEEAAQTRVQIELEAITVDMNRHFGRLCPHTNVEMSDDMELIVWLDQDTCYTSMGWEVQRALIPVGQTVTIYHWPDQFAEKFST